MNLHFDQSTHPSADKNNDDLVHRAQDGDSEAFASLFELHRRLVYSICLRMTRNPAEAEDLTQEAFIQVMRRISSFRGDSAFSSWLYRVAVNTVLMRMRKETLRFTTCSENGDDKCANAGSRHFPGKADERLCETVDRLAICRALETLAPGYRRVFELHEIEGYDHREIAQLLNCTIGTSKSQLYKARLLLRRKLRTSNLRFASVRNSALDSSWFPN